MPSRRILVIQGHPDASRRHLGHALEDAYVRGALDAGHSVRRLQLSTLDIALLSSQRDWEDGGVPPALEAAQADIAWAEHLVLLFPLWLGDMPARVKAFLEQVLRPGFAFSYVDARRLATHKHLRGRSAQLVVTMGMPALAYRWIFGAHAVRLLKRNILGFVGIAPVRETLVGQAGAMTEERLLSVASRLRRLGAAAR